MRRRIRLVAFLLTFPLVACGDESPAAPEQPDVPGPPASIILSTDTVRLAALGAVYPLDATVIDSNGIALGDATVEWAGGDGTVATVDGSGRVEATGPGETEVTATAGDVSDVATVIVTQSATAISVSPPFAELNALGDSVRYTATVRDANGNVIPDAAVVWSSADEGVATVDESGWAVAQANGTASLTAGAGSVSDEAAVRVDQVAASVDVSPVADTLAQGDTTRLTATVADANGEPMPGAQITWSTSDPAADVDASGLVTAAGWSADATITATAEGVTGEAGVHVLGQIAFVSGRGGDFEIYAMHADGSEPAAIEGTPTSRASTELHPAWSPDGSRLAFTTARDGNDEIYVMPADGSNPIRLTTDGSFDWMPTWSPDGTRIAFTSQRDGDADIWVMNADGTGKTNLTNATSQEYQPSWSPDGSQIAFRSDRDGGDYDIYVMDADGSNQTRLTTDPAFDGAPRWSPDGTRIAFYSRRDGDADIYIMDADGSILEQITNVTEDDLRPAWSPDGSRIAFHRQFGTNEEVFVMDADGSNPIRLTDNDVFDSWIMWRPRP